MMCAVYTSVQANSFEIVPSGKLKIPTTNFVKKTVFHSVGLTIRTLKYCKKSSENYGMNNICCSFYSDYHLFYVKKKKKKV